VKALKLGPPMLVAETARGTLVARAVLRPKFRDFDTDEVGHLVDKLLWRMGELGEKDAPKTLAEVNAVIGLYGEKTEEAKLWKRMKRELLRTLKKAKPVEYED
jgi:hypothetical protein